MAEWQAFLWSFRAKKDIMFVSINEKMEQENERTFRHIRIITAQHVLEHNNSCPCFVVVITTITKREALNRIIEAYEYYLNCRHTNEMKV